MIKKKVIQSALKPRSIGGFCSQDLEIIIEEFVALVLLSFLMATPIALHFLNQWLQNYAYHPQISWWINAATGAGALLITLVTVSFQAIKAAIANPVKSIRTESLNNYHA